MMLVTTTVEHDGRRFTVRSTLGGDCRLAMLLALVRTAVDQAGGEVNPDGREVADWLTEEVGHTSPRTVSQLLRQLVHAGDLTRRRVGNSWYYGPTPSQQVMIAAISAPPRRRERIPSASHTSATTQPAHQVVAPPHTSGVPAAYSAANQPVAPSDAGELQVRCTVGDTPATHSDAVGAQVGYAVAAPVAEAPHATSRAPAGRLNNIKLNSRPAGSSEVEAEEPAKSPDPPERNAAGDRPQCSTQTCYCDTDTCVGMGGQMIGGRKVRDRCPKHAAPLLESRRIGAVAAGGGFKYCPSAIGGKCTFLVHDTGGVMIQRDDPRGEVGFEEFWALLTTGGRAPIAL